MALSKYERRERLRMRIRKTVEGTESTRDGAASLQKPPGAFTGAALRSAATSCVHQGAGPTDLASRVGDGGWGTLGAFWHNPTPGPFS